MYLQWTSIGNTAPPGVHSPQHTCPNMVYLFVIQSQKKQGMETLSILPQTLHMHSTTDCTAKWKARLTRHPEMWVGGVGRPRRVLQDVGSIPGDLCSVRRAQRARPVMAGGLSFSPPYALSV